MISVIFQCRRFSRHLVSNLCNDGQQRTYSQISGYGPYAVRYDRRSGPDTANVLDPEGVATLSVYFRDHSFPNAQGFASIRTMLGPEDAGRKRHMEFDVYLPASEIAWVLPILSECDGEDRFLTVTGISSNQETQERFKVRASGDPHRVDFAAGSLKMDGARISQADFHSVFLSSAERRISNVDAS